jgi:hypothetical protein
MEAITKEQALEVLKKERQERLSVVEKDFKEKFDLFCEMHNCRISVIIGTSEIGGILHGGHKIILND